MTEHTSRVKYPKPDWLINTFAENHDGFFFSENIDESSIPTNSPNVHIALAGALLRLRKGEYSAGEQVVDTLLPSNDAGIWDDGLRLLAHAIPHASLLALGRRILDAAEHIANHRSADAKRGAVCEAWSRAMMISAVPEMIEIYRNTEWIDQRWIILLELADIFEPVPGELHDAIDLESDSFDEEGHLNTLMEHHAAAMEMAESARTPLFYKGEPFDLSSWCINFLKRITLKDSIENFGTDRMFFEANTGICCKAFFGPHGEFLPMAAAAIVNRFLASENSKWYEPGVRYFFGHPLPDRAR